jgi:hypothetical protein
VDAVTKRPQRLVGESIVVALLFALVEPDAPEAVLRIGGRHIDAATRIDNESVGCAGPVCHPYA